MDYKEKLAEIGYDWPNVSPNDLPFEALVRVGDTVYVSGQIPERGEDILFTGQVDPDVPADETRRAAGHCAANILFWLERELARWPSERLLQHRPEHLEVAVTASASSGWPCAEISASRSVIDQNPI